MYGEILMKTKASILVLFAAVLFLGQTSGKAGAFGTERMPSYLSINLKARSVILGPQIKLGDLSHIYVSNTRKKVTIGKVTLGAAPPPGESTEISLNYIKRRLRTEGLEEYIQYLKGPRTIRVITAQNEIDKAFSREELANLILRLSRKNPKV